MSSQKFEIEYRYTGFEPKAIAADAGHLNNVVDSSLMEENEIIRASSTYLVMSVENRSQTVDIYDWIKSSC